MKYGELLEIIKELDSFELTAGQKNELVKELVTIYGRDKVEACR